jgi:AcrR family transcriptional regulator
MTAAPDRRQAKTRAALHNAFRSLLLGQGYEALTVGAVADTANVGRSTFYEHYRTMDDLLRESVQGPFATLADLVDKPAAGAALVSLLLHFRENQQVARVLLGWPTRPVLASALTQLIAARLRAVALAAPLIPADVIARQIAEMQLALIDAWIAGRPAMQPDAVANALCAGTGALMSVLAGRVR